MMPLPCPSCAQPLELKLDFLIINPTVQCPHCYAVMKFDLDNEANQKMKRGLREIEEFIIVMQNGYAICMQD